MKVGKPSISADIAVAATMAVGVAATPRHSSWELKPRTRNVGSLLYMCLIFSRFFVFCSWLDIFVTLAMLSQEKPPDHFYYLLLLLGHLTFSFLVLKNIWFGYNDL